MEPPLIVIVGPTASGKSALATQVSEVYCGEIVCSDSRTIYKGMDIGTAKPSKEDQARVPHWGLDLVEPGERFTAADFQAYARKKIQEIRARGHVPVLVGGTGLYVDGVIFNFEFKNTLLEKQRKLFEEMSIEQLLQLLQKHHIPLPENSKNKRHLIRRLEIGGINDSRQNQPVENCIIVGITTNTDELKLRIRGRSEQLFDDGVVEEAKRLGNKYGWDSEAMTGNIYRLVHEYVLGQISEDILREKFIVADWQLAKKQLTWFRRNPYIKWMSLDEAYDYLSLSLADHGIIEHESYSGRTGDDR